MKPFIIAEAGINHNGDINTAYKLIDVAIDAGADSVKFQTLNTEKLVSRYAPKAEYQDKNIGVNDSQFVMLKKLELSCSEFEKLKEYCDTKGILFLSTPFDEESSDFLESIGMKVFKIPSGEVANKPLIEHIAKKGKPIILSTGMSFLAEVEEAIGWINECCVSVRSKEKLGDYRFSVPLTILHCVSNYPTPPEDVNLLAMKTMEAAFGLPVGYSDHTAGIEISVGAVALGAIVIEKHFTLDKNMDGPDHSASLDPAELKAMVSAIRNMEKALGDGLKQPAPSEFNVRDVARKSLVAARAIKAGEKIKEEDIVIKRPGTGILPKLRGSVIGTKATRDIRVDSVIVPEDFE